MLLENHCLIVAVEDKNVSLKVVDSEFNFEQSNYCNNQVHILASGPSIHTNNLKLLKDEPIVFLNGSITLMADYHFSNPVAYIITDPRFIRHNLEIVLTYYTGFCSLYISDLVAQQLLQDAPEFLYQYQPFIHIIYPVNRPVLYQPLMPKDASFFAKLWVKWQKRPKLKQFKTSPYHQVMGKKIGVSFDIRHGFVEGGTVAYVALQLAYSLGFRKLHLYGVDLLNSHTPRFYENNQNTAPSKLDQAVINRIVPSFNFAAQAYQIQGGVIYNHSPISKALFKSIEYVPE